MLKGLIKGLFLAGVLGTGVVLAVSQLLAPTTIPVLQIPLSAPHVPSVKVPLGAGNAARGAGKSALDARKSALDAGKSAVETTPQPRSGVPARPYIVASTLPPTLSGTTPAPLANGGVFTGASPVASLAVASGAPPSKIEPPLKVMTDAAPSAGAGTNPARVSVGDPPALDVLRPDQGAGPLARQTVGAQPMPVTSSAPVTTFIPAITLTRQDVAPAKIASIGAPSVRVLALPGAQPAMPAQNSGTAQIIVPQNDEGNSALITPPVVAPLPHLIRLGDALPTPPSPPLFSPVSPATSATPVTPPPVTPPPVTPPPATDKPTRLRIGVARLTDRVPMLVTGQGARLHMEPHQTLSNDTKLPLSQNEVQKSEPKPALMANAEPFKNPHDLPLMAVILIDDAARPISKEALAHFPFPVTFAIDPERDDAEAVAQRYRAAGFEVLMLTDFPKITTPRDIEVTLQIDKARMPQAVAVMDRNLHGFQRARSLVQQMVQNLAESGQGLLTYDIGLNPAKQLAPNAGVRTASVFRKLDANDEKAPLIKRYLDRAAFRAAQEGSVIVIGKTRPQTIEALVTWALDRRAASVAVVPLSAVLRGK